MAKFERLGRQLLCLQQYKTITLTRRRISLLTLQQVVLDSHSGKSCNIKNKEIGTFSSSIGQNIIQSCGFSSYMGADDNESKKYKELVKNYSFQVPSFGGSVSANSPVDVTVGLLIRLE